jgi:hypothetical protein
MTDEQMSKRTDRALHRAFESVVLTQFPNPERNDCPGIGTLRQIAKKRISMLDPAVDHVAHCSPCFAELGGIRRTARRNKALSLLTTAVGAVLLLWVLISHSVFWNTASPPQSQPIAVLLDLRSASASRLPQIAGSNLNHSPIAIPHGLIDLNIDLPLGAEAGRYEVQFRKETEVIVTKAGQADIENGITHLTINVDTRAIPAGEYQFGWRLQNFDWQYYPITIP